MSTNENESFLTFDDVRQHDDNAVEIEKITNELKEIKNELEKLNNENETDEEKEKNNEIRIDLFDRMLRIRMMQELLLTSEEEIQKRIHKQLKNIFDNSSN